MEIIFIRNSRMKHFTQSHRRPVSDKPTGASFGKSSGTSSYTTRRTDHPDKNRDRLYRAVQTPSSNFKKVIKERFVASLFETVGCNCGNEYRLASFSAAPGGGQPVTLLPCARDFHPLEFIYTCCNASGR